MNFADFYYLSRPEFDFIHLSINRVLIFVLCRYPKGFWTSMVLIGFLIHQSLRLYLLLELLIPFFDSLVSSVVGQVD